MGGRGRARAGTIRPLPCGCGEDAAVRICGPGHIPASDSRPRVLFTSLGPNHVPVSESRRSHVPESGRGHVGWCILPGSEEAEGKGRVKGGRRGNGVQRRNKACK